MNFTRIAYTGFLLILAIGLGSTLSGRSAIILDSNGATARTTTATDWVSLRYVAGGTPRNTAWPWEWRSGGSSGFGVWGWWSDNYGMFTTGVQLTFGVGRTQMEFGYLNEAGYYQYFSTGYIEYYPPSAPVITSQPVSQTVMIVGPVTFSVSASGWLPPTYQWRKNSVNLAGATESSFTVTGVQAGDSGQYNVVVMNASGAAVSSNAVLTVEPYPLYPFTYTTNNGTITITGYTGSSRAVIIPSTITGLPVTSIGSRTFYECYKCSILTSITIPKSVTNIGHMAFALCDSLKGVYFTGSTPTSGSAVFYGDNNATVYYLPGTTGWGLAFAGLPTALWQVQIADASIGVWTNQFGFNITWGSNLVVVVEACTNLGNHAWFPVSTNTLTGGSSYFRDRQWTNYTRRFYRLRAPG